MDENLQSLIACLYVELGRFPTEKEVTEFIFGDEETRKQILKKKEKNG